MAELRKYGAATTILFPLIERGAVDFETGVTFASGDVKIIKDEGAAANTSNLPSHEGNGIYSLALTATEMQAARIVITVIDASPTKVWEDQAILMDTYGDVSAQHGFDLGDTLPDVKVVSFASGVISAYALATDAAEEIADVLLKRAISNVEPGAGFRTLYGAIASFVNRRRISGANVEVYKTDDATVLGSLAMTTDPDQAPVTELDP